VPFNDVSNLYFLCYLLSITILKEYLGTILMLNIVRSRMNIWTIPDKLLNFLHIMLVNSLRIGQVLCYVDGNHNLINPTVGVWGNDSSSSEINSLSGQIQPEPALLAL